MARRDRTREERVPGVREGSPRDELLSGVDFVWKSGGGSLNKGMTLRPSAAGRRSATVSASDGKANPTATARKH
ncbi:hypothetical protein J2Y41_004562 [Arthrobacter sp. 1088]|uniref:hypothetical protein n=1 Tax=Arthrobacter sp. 1088 TaxID=2817768 RepID=UPI00285938F4|nr:hypothetical protein [Arthrobacter sp. 1088]MDR6688963.1 hypothetical protein [Arthrobacter sp. 1088]